MSTDAVGFVPVELRLANGAIAQFYPSNAFAFPPAAAAVETLEAPDFANRAAGGDRLRMCDSAEDSEIHRLNLQGGLPARLTSQA
jgi:hypothetical protein